MEQKGAFEYSSSFWRWSIAMVAFQGPTPCVKRQNNTNFFSFRGNWSDVKRKVSSKYEPPQMEEASSSPDIDGRWKRGTKKSIKKEKDFSLSLWNKKGILSLICGVENIIPDKVFALSHPFLDKVFALSHPKKLYMGDWKMVPQQQQQQQQDEEQRFPLPDLSAAPQIKSEAEKAGFRGKKLKWEQFRTVRTKDRARERHRAVKKMYRLYLLNST